MLKHVNIFSLFVSDNPDPEPTNWELVLSGSLSHELPLPLPLPIVELDLDVAVVEKQYVKFEVVSYHGIGGGLEYFDIVRPGTAKLKSEVKRDCSRGSGQCPALPQFCPHQDCVPDTLSWLDIFAPEMKPQQGCTNNFGVFRTSDAFCLTGTPAALQQKQDVDGVIQFDWQGLQLGKCQPWSVSEPCEIKPRLVAEKRTETSGNTFSLEHKLCNGEMGVDIELVGISDGLNKTGLKLSYLPVSHYPVELSETGTCFRTERNLCGPDSLSFFSEEGDLVLTNCDGELTMRKEYDFCG